jgi:hypothetical protein
VIVVVGSWLSAAYCTIRGISNTQYCIVAVLTLLVTDQPLTNHAIPIAIPILFHYRLAPPLHPPLSTALAYNLIALMKVKVTDSVHHGRSGAADTSNKWQRVLGLQQFHRHRHLRLVISEHQTL